MFHGPTTLSCSLDILTLIHQTCGITIVYQCSHYVLGTFTYDICIEREGGCPKREILLIGLVSVPMLKIFADVIYVNGPFVAVGNPFENDTGR